MRILCPFPLTRLYDFNVVGRGPRSIKAGAFQAFFVLAGPSKDIDRCKETLLKENIVAIKIKGSCAFHSSLQNNIKNDILESTKNISYNTPKIQLISTVTGFIADNEDFVEDYWWKNIRNVVKFSESIEQCIDTDIFIEISPHTVLSSSIQQHYPEKIILQSGNRKEDSACRFLSSSPPGHHPPLRSWRNGFQGLAGSIPGGSHPGGGHAR